MNIFDYLQWRGDLKFDVDPFNDVDNLVISFLAYVKFENYIDTNRTYTIKELSTSFFSERSEESVLKDKGFTAKAPLILKAMAGTSRYGDCRLKNLISIISKSSTEQFCAFELELDAETSYLVYRGTDDTLIGWQEDFCLAYTITSAQKRAVNYLKDVCKSTRKYYVGGHSKGGNLAEYAVVSNPCLLKQIIWVYSNDGPGLNRELLGTEQLEALPLLSEKLRKIVPEFDFFGTIFGNDKECLIVKSQENNILSHDLLTWQVLANHLVEGTISNDTILIGQAFKTFLENVTNDKKELFVGELFKAMNDAGMQNMSDFAHSGLEVLFNTLKNFAEMDKESKNVANELAKAFYNQYKDNFKSEIKKVLGNDEKSH